MSRAGDRHRAKKKRCLALKRWRRWKWRRPNYGPSPLAGAYAPLRALRMISGQVTLFGKAVAAFGLMRNRPDFAWYTEMEDRLEKELERLCPIDNPE